MDAEVDVFVLKKGAQALLAEKYYEALSNRLQSYSVLLC